MYFRFNFIILLFKIITSQNISNYYSNVKWVSSNFGSSFASLPCFYDFNHDGSVDMMALSVDGEIISYDLLTGEPLQGSNWPVYISNDHFFSKPLMYIYGENFNQELIVIISQKGLIYFFDWKGILVNTLKINNIYLSKNWSFIDFKSIDEVLFLKKNGSDDAYFELHPEIYADGTILDLNRIGISEDLVIPVNFVSSTLGTRDVIISVLVVFNLVSKTILTLHPLKISTINSESPEYVLNNFDLLNTETYEIIITSSSGIIYKLRWDIIHKQFISIFYDSLIYNSGPNKCRLTEFCKNSNNQFSKNSLCCIYTDYYGHMVMMNLLKPGSLWEYEFKDAGTATEPEFFINSLVNSDQRAFAIFATNKGWVHCVSLLTGMTYPLFPLVFENESFSTNPKIVLDSRNHASIIILSDEGNLYKIPIDSPKEWQILIHNDQLSSFLSPIILQSPKKIIQSDIIIQSKNGFIFKYELFGLKPLNSKFSKATINTQSSGIVSTLYSFGSSFSFDLSIHDNTAVSMNSSGYYIIKIFVNEILFMTHKELYTYNKVTYSRIVVDLKTLNKDLISPSVFLFGTVTIKVTDQMGQAFPVDYFYLRINYDFQFELIWIVYLTFSICTITVLVLHFYNDNHKFNIPIYRDSVTNRKI